MVGGGRYLADAETGECWMNVQGLLFKSEGGHGLRRRTRTLAPLVAIFFGIFACSSGNVQAMEGIASARRTSRPANRVKTRGMGGDSGHAPWPTHGPLFRPFVWNASVDNYNVAARLEDTGEATDDRSALISKREIGGLGQGSAGQ
jgi:hypothetical protein